MEEIKQQQPDNNLDKVEKPLPDTQIEVVEKKVATAPQEKLSTADTQQKTQPIDTINPEAIIKETKKTKIVTTDVIAIGGLFVNILLAIFTYLLFKEATSSTKIATDAVEEARRSNSISEKNYQLAKVAFEESKKSGQEATQLANKTLETQIGTLKENQKQFNISNEPLLSIVNSNIELLEAGKPLLSKVQVINLGNYPCKVIECKTVITIRIAAPNFKEVYQVESTYSDILNKYILRDNPVPSPFETSLPLNENQVLMVKTGDYFVYMTGFIRYKNIISNKIKTYKFQLKMKPGYETENIINENIDQ
ncbi:MAG: hypothetical protein BWX95_01526 [Bacteroidetes bacterium ADurb.Bin141]|nr:MAG: hypothetical protein BWX95_01526 [Bacteroidetes bacterium ADurb.Bin141]